MVKAWMISIVGVICLGVLLEIVLPEGKTAKYVRGAFSLLVLFVIISPLSSLLGKDAPAQLSPDWLQVDEAYVYDAYASYASRLESTAKDWLEERGLEGEVKAVLDGGALSRIEVKLTSFEDADALREELAAKLCVSKAKVAVICAADG